MLSWGESVGPLPAAQSYQINQIKQSKVQHALKWNKPMQLLPAKARVSWCSWWEEKRMVGLMSFVVKFSQGGVNSVCLSADCISMSSITWKSWGYLSGESQASSSGLNGDKSCADKKGKDISVQLYKVFPYMHEHRLFTFHLWIFSFRLHWAFMLQVLINVQLKILTWWILVWLFPGLWIQYEIEFGISVCWSSAKQHRTPDWTKASMHEIQIVYRRHRQLSVPYYQLLHRLIITSTS